MKSWTSFILKPKFIHEVKFKERNHYKFENLVAEYQEQVKKSAYVSGTNTYLTWVLRKREIINSLYERKLYFNVSIVDNEILLISSEKSWIVLWINNFFLKRF